MTFPLAGCEKVCSVASLPTTPHHDVACIHPRPAHCTCRPGLQSPAPSHSIDTPPLIRGNDDARGYEPPL